MNFYQINFEEIIVKIKILWAAILIFAAVIGVTAQSTAKIFRGFVNGIPVQINLTRKGSELSGNYFYSRVGKEIQLAGKINQDGSFNLTETDADGKKTGEFSGKWTEEAEDNGASLEGEWRKPGDKEPGSFVASEQIIEFSGGAKFVSKQFAEKNKTKRFDIDVEYPQLEGANSPSVGNFNQLVKMRAMAGVAGFRKDMLAMSAADLKILPSGTNNYLDIGYGIEWANDDQISVLFTNSDFTGGVHPNYNFTVLNYDLKNSREITFAEIFKPKAKYLKFISDYSIDVLKKRFKENGDDETIKSGAAAKAENFKSWNLVKKGLMITFDPYQVASYAEGSQTVIIPYSKLSQILQPKYVSRDFKK